MRYISDAELEDAQLFVERLRRLFSESRAAFNDDTTGPQALVRVADALRELAALRSLAAQLNRTSEAALLAQHAQSIPPPAPRPTN